METNENNTMEKRYGFVTALSLVIGIVIGSGIFFKAVKVLKLTGGNMKAAMIVIAIVGCICIGCSILFARMGRKYAHCNGLVDYSEVTLGPKYAYIMGWYLSTFYYPIIAATLSYIAASYFAMIVGLEMYGQFTTGLSVFFMSVLIVLNMLAPKMAGKFQVATTIIKLVPLIAMAVIGLIIGIANGNTVDIMEIANQSEISGDGILAGVCAFAFSYEGWISSTAVNQELKNPKRDLPLALVIGGIFCTVLYMSYVLSMSASMTADEIIAAGDLLPKIAFGNIFGEFAGNIILFIVIISCLGVANGMTMCTMRGFYALAVRNEGPNPKALSEIDKYTGMPLKSCILGAGIMGFWLFQTSTLCFQGPLIFNGTGNPDWLLAWEADEICIIALYLMYLPIFVHIILKEKDFGFVYRYILPVFAICASLFMCYCCYVAYGIQLHYFAMFWLIVMGIGLYLKHPDKKYQLRKRIKERLTR